MNKNWLIAPAAATGAPNIREFSRFQRPRAASAQHDTHEVDRIPRTELFHDAGTVDLHGPKADAHLAGGFLAGCPDRNLIEHIDLALRQQVPTGKPACADLRGVEIVSPT